MSDTKSIEWRHISGVPVGYEVSNTGEVRLNYGDHTEEIKQHRSANGEMMVYIFGKQLRVSRVVAEAFLEKSTSKMIVKHLNGDSGDNRVENLKWITYTESAKNSYKLGKLRGKRVFCAETGKMYATVQTAAYCTGLQICAVEYGLQNGCKMFGYTFTPVDEDVPYTDDIVLVTKQQIIELGKKLDSTTLLSVDEYMKL